MADKSEITHLENFHDRMFDALSESILVVDNNGKIMLANHEADLLFKFQEGELIGQNIEILIPKKFTHTHKKQRANYNANPHPRRMKGMELSACRSDQSVFPVEVSLNPVIIEDQPCTIALIIDITKRKKMEKRLREAELVQSNLAHEQQLAEIKNQLVAMVSHELRTPLAILNTSADLLTDYFDQLALEKRAYHLELMKSQVEKLSQLLEDILIVSKSGTKQTQFMPVMAHIETFCRTICTQLGLDSDPRFSFQAESLEEIEIDQRLIEHFLTNLLTNAQKYTPEDGQISLKISREKQDIVFTVSDTGIGIPQEDQARLFKPFHRASNTATISGTGLGLTIVKNSVEEHGGSIEFTSNVDEGSMFIIKIPII